jgi:hypothetical protein
MCGRFRHGIGTWLGVAALLCQILLPFGLAQLADPMGPGLSEQAAQAKHHHDPNLANSLGSDWASGHSHAGDMPSVRVRLDFGYLTPFAAINPPAGLAVVLRWVAFVPDRAAQAPLCTDSFNRPLPRAPPLPV